MGLGDITERANGTRSVGLFLPFDHDGARVESLDLAPVAFDLTLRWQTGEFKSVLDLLCTVANVSEALVRKIKYPDVDRVLEQFMSMIPAQIRDDITNGTVPVKRYTMSDPDQLIEPEPLIHRPDATFEELQAGGRDDMGLGVDALGP